MQKWFHWLLCSVSARLNDVNDCTWMHINAYSPSMVPWKITYIKSPLMFWIEFSPPLELLMADPLLLLLNVDSTCVMRCVWKSILNPSTVAMLKMIVEKRFMWNAASAKMHRLRKNLYELKANTRLFTFSGHRLTTLFSVFSDGWLYL